MSDKRTKEAKTKNQSKNGKSREATLISGGPQLKFIGHFFITWYSKPPYRECPGISSNRRIR